MGKIVKQLKCDAIKVIKLSSDTRRKLALINGNYDKKKIFKGIILTT